LQRQADELAPESTLVLDQTGLSPGQSALDLGCGPRGVLDLLADRVGSDGRVVGVDADAAHVAMAAEFAAGQGFANVRVLMADARDTGLPSGSFDVVHARTLLVTVPEPAVVASEMARLARPGGWVASVEPDTEYMLCYPRNAAFDRISAFFPSVFSRNGADPWIGRRVSELLRKAGLEDIEVRVTAQAYPAGHTRRTIRLDLLKSIRPQLLEMGLASAEELDELDAAARAHLDDPSTVVVYGLLFLTWGRVPG
jgi:ubiquinone/menaquinone biosynthesis C-methylase UbiE